MTVLVFLKTSRPEIENKKKGIIKVFKKCRLSIVVDTNLKTVDILGVTFDLDKNTYKAYRKPNDSPIYINKNLNHSAKILKQLPKSIAMHISETLSSEEIFNKSVKIYSKALKKNGFMDELKSLPDEVQQLENSEERKHKRKIIWFNPPYPET